MVVSATVPEAYFDPDDPDWNEEDFYGDDPEADEYYEVLEEDLAEWEDNEEGEKLCLCKC